MGCCNDCLTCDIAFNAVMSLSRASTRGSYSRIEGVTNSLDREGARLLSPCGSQILPNQLAGAVEPCR